MIDTCDKHVIYTIVSKGVLRKYTRPARIRPADDKREGARPARIQPADERKRENFQEMREMGCPYISDPGAYDR